MRQRIYLDYASSTPIDPRVKSAMEPYWSKEFGNPGSLHSFGQKASAAIFEARQIIARALSCHYREIIFTSGATEANNLALRGSVRRFITERGAMLQEGEQPRVIVSAIEHESVLDTAKCLEEEGVEVVIIPVDKQGIVNYKKIKTALNERTVIVSIMYANNEIGTIQPISEIADMIAEVRSKNKELRANPLASNILNPKSIFSYPLFHTDAAQAFQYLPCTVDRLGIDLMTISSQKIYGPKGAGALYMRRQRIVNGALEMAKQTNSPSAIGNTPMIAPIITGGGQEDGLRSGTENVPAIVGFGAAVDLLERVRVKEAGAIRVLRDYLLREVRRIFPGLTVNGSLKERLPNNLNVSLPVLSSEQLLASLDLRGVAISAGSACSSRSLDPSPTLLALGTAKEKIMRSIRITLGRPTTKAELKTVIQILEDIANSPTQSPE